MNTKYIYIGSRGFAFYCPLFAFSVTKKEISLHLFQSRTYRITL